MTNNRSGKAVTFLVLCNEDAVGEGTLLLSPTCSAIAGRKVLCDGKATANINALRIQKAYEGKGHISKLIREMEQFALRNHITKLTIGVEAKETRTLAIYLHLGFTEFLFAEIEEGELVLYFGKQTHHLRTPEYRNSLPIPLFSTGREIGRCFNKLFCKESPPRNGQAFLRGNQQMSTYFCNI